MIDLRVFELPQGCTETATVLRRLDGAVEGLTEDISCRLGAGFEGRLLDSQSDFGGYTSWRIEVRRYGKLVAFVTLEWSEDLDPTRYSISIADAEPLNWAPIAAAGSFALGGAALGMTPVVSTEAALAFTIVGGALGFAMASAVKRIVGGMRPLARPTTDSTLEALTWRVPATLSAT